MTPHTVCEGYFITRRHAAGGDRDETFRPRRVIELAAIEDFDEIIRTNEERLMRYATEMTGSPEDARDIVQNTLLKAWNAYRAGSRPEHPKAWLFRIAHNEIANHLRGKRVRRDVHRTIVLNLPTRESDAFLVQEVFRAVLKLPEPYREALSLHYFHGLSLAETAEVLDIPLGSAKTLVARGLQMIRREVRE